MVLGLRKLFLKTLVTKSSEGFQYMKATFPKINDTKLIKEFTNHNFFIVLYETKLRILKYFKLLDENILATRDLFEFINGVKCLLD